MAAPLSIWDGVLEITQMAQKKVGDPLLWALQISSKLNSYGVSLPSPELATVLVSYICWDNNVPVMWKFLDKALVLNLVPPFLVLALLSHRVIPCRRSKPVVYRLYMELLRRHAFELKGQINGPNYEKIMKSIDDVLHLSENFGLEASDSGILVVEFIYSIVWQLLDASLDDEGLLELTSDKMSVWSTKPQDMEIDDHENFDERRMEHNGKLFNMNTVMAVEMIGRFLKDKKTSRILYLARHNLPTHWPRFIERLQLLGANSSAIRNSKVLTSEDLLRWASDKCTVLTQEPNRNLLQKFHAVTSFESPSVSSSVLCDGGSISSLWLPLDLALEDAMDGYQVNATSAIEIVKCLVKALQAMNGTTWHDTFVGLWIAALRLVQRERDPIEGPIPRLDTRLCMLLSIIPLVVAELIEEEDNAPTEEVVEYESTNHWKEKRGVGKRRNDVVSSIQLLGDYHSLLTPPQSVVSLANQAAAKAMLLVSGINVGSSYLECVSMKDMPVSCSGNMRHLIVEACIARNLLDTSAYLWPGYVNGHINQMPNVPPQMPGWSSFLKGAPFTPIMINAMVSTPASSLAELEKVFELAVKGSDDEKISAATILCGASLLRGWNIQEHTAQFITRLLSPPKPPDYSGDESHLIGAAPILNLLIVGISPVDCVQVFSLHGLIPQLACSLMPVCEVFGSCVPDVSWKLPNGDEISAHAVFSNAFAVLLKLWRFNHPPLEHGVGDVPTVGSQLTPEYLLLVRNSYLPSSGIALNDQTKRRLSKVSTSSSPHPVFLDSFPRLKCWYRQHQKCIASALSGLVHGTTVHQTVNSLLTMMFRKINRGSQSVTTITSGSSSSSGPGNEDSSLRPKLPAWEILEAVPFVVDAALTACAHGRLCPRELATGLKDLADFLPGSLATIVSYFSAEVSRGVWKPAFMNGTDWPSPAANLSNVEDKIKKILAATGVDIPSLAAGGSSPATLPLPLAAFVSLTITYKIDKTSERFLNLAGPALETLAAGCPWPCMPIVASLWTLKAKRWFDFLVFSASRTVFLHNNDAVFQLLKSCFTATLSGAAISSNGGVGALLGHGFGSHFCGGISPVAPGILYLRVYQSIRDIEIITEEIISLMMQSVTQVACTGLPKERIGRLKRTKNGLECGQVSLAAAMRRVKLAASLGASLVCLSGGLGLVQLLFQETLPSWFISSHHSEQEEDGCLGGMVAMLRGYALAYFAVLCGAFAWGIGNSSSSCRRRPKVLRAHMEFLASALDGKISLGCDNATWKSYVSGFLSLMVGCTPPWVLDLDADVLKRLSKGLRQWNEEELALALLGIGGVETMGAAAELIFELH
ncbi:Mediator of RNA polymerase II transcription subunit 33A [Linum perenne]